MVRKNKSSSTPAFRSCRLGIKHKLTNTIKIHIQMNESVLWWAYKFIWISFKKTNVRLFIWIRYITLLPQKMSNFVTLDRPYSTDAQCYLKLEDAISSASLREGDRFPGRLQPYDYRVIAFAVRQSWYLCRMAPIRWTRWNILLQI